MTFIKTFLKKMGGFFGRQEKTSVPLLRALAEVAGSTAIKQVLASSPDRRYWLTLSAAWVGTSERELLGKLGREMGLVVHTSEIEGLDLSVLGASPRTMIQELRRAGAVPCGNAGKVDVVYCVDPAELITVSGIGLSYLVRLAPWVAIESALRALETLLDEQDESARTLERERTYDVAKQILGFLLVEVESYGTQELTILNGEEGLTYTFATHDSRQASGRVFPRVASSLLEFFEASKNYEPSRILLHGKGTYRDVKISSLAPGGNFKLSWIMSEIPGAESKQETKSESFFLPPVAEQIDSVDNSKIDTEIQEQINETRNINHKEQRLIIPPVNQGIRRPMVVVIDDNVMFVKVLERFLDRGGMDSVHAIHGEEGLKLLKEIPFHPDMPPVIVCDLHMPVMNGREFISRLRQEPELKSLKVVILTSDDDVEAELNLITLGADAFLAKSKDPRVLTAQVRRLAGVPAEAQAA